MRDPIVIWHAGDDEIVFVPTPLRVFLSFHTWVTGCHIATCGSKRVRRCLSEWAHSADSTQRVDPTSTDTEANLGWARRQKGGKNASF
jgi:hypothetical protein